MTGFWSGGNLVILGAALAISAPAAFNTAHAARPKTGHHAAFSIQHSHYGYARFARRGWGGGLQCVPFARENTGIELAGNANTWWNQAEGVYERGAKPEVGSILNFRATGRMRMGHVAVVANVLDSRRIEIDHANWGGPGRISRNTEVVDVSPANDWTEVRVALDQAEELGSVYPTYGFIYDRPDHGTMLANAGVTPAPASAQAEAAAPAEPEEVAEAVDDPAPRYSRHRWYRHGRVHVLGSRGRFAPHATLYRVSDRSGGRAEAAHAPAAVALIASHV